MMSIKAEHSTQTLAPIALRSPSGFRHVLVVQYSARRDGSAFSALLLANGFLEDDWETTVAFGHEGPMVEVFREHGHRAVVVPHKNWLRTKQVRYFIRNALREWQASERIRRLLAEIEPDLVYVNTGASIVGSWAARKARVPCVWHLRELFSDVQGELETPPGGRPLARWTFYKLADQLVAPSQAVAINLLGKRAREVEVVPNAAGAAFFECTLSPEEARHDFELPAEGPVLGVPGTLRPMKGHSFLFEALPAVLQKIPELTIAVTGGVQGKYVKELQRLVREYKLGGHVRFLGTIKNMPAFLRASDIVCIPSVAEPFGRTVIEAFAVGTPVVATAVGGIRETIDDGETGLLVPYGNTSALAAALVRLLQKPALQAEIAERAADKAVQLYHEQAYKRALVAIARKLVDEKEIATQK